MRTLGNVRDGRAAAARRFAAGSHAVDAGKAAVLALLAAAVNPQRVAGTTQFAVDTQPSVARRGRTDVKFLSLPEVGPRTRILAVLRRGEQRPLAAAMLATLQVPPPKRGRSTS